MGREIRESGTPKGRGSRLKRTRERDGREERALLKGTREGKRERKEREGKRERRKGRECERERERERAREGESFSAPHVRYFDRKTNVLAV